MMKQTFTYQAVRLMLVVLLAVFALSSCNDENDGTDTHNLTSLWEVESFIWDVRTPDGQLYEPDKEEGYEWLYTPGKTYHIDIKRANPEDNECFRLGFLKDNQFVTYGLERNSDGSYNWHAGKQGTYNIQGKQITFLDTWLYPINISNPPAHEIDKEAAKTVTVLSHTENQLTVQSSVPIRNLQTGVTANQLTTYIFKRIQ